jgi:GTPase SAR1 family protein
MAQITWAGRQYTMPRIIVITGPGSSGKTTSIRQFLEVRKIRYTKKKGDVTIVVRVQKRNTTLAVGVASGGDTPAIFANNFNFLLPRTCDVIVCASKSKGSTINFIRNTFGNNLILIPISKLKNPSPTQISARNAVIAQAIERHI